MEWSDTALVIGVGRFRETDMWVRLLTEHRGLVSAFAFGGSCSRRRFCGCLDLFNLLRVRAKTTRNGQYLALQEGVLLGGPHRLRTDRLRLGMYMNCVRFVEALGVAPDGGAAALALLGDLRTLFEEADAVSELVPTLFRLRMASDQGYQPTLSHCGHCGADMIATSRAFFAVNDGVVFCPACAGRQTAGIMVSPVALDVLRQIQEDSPLVWRVDDLPAEERRQCARVIDGFIQYHLGLRWDKGRFQRN